METYRFTTKPRKTTASTTRDSKTTPQNPKSDQISATTGDLTTLRPKSREIEWLRVERLTTLQTKSREIKWLRAERSATCRDQQRAQQTMNHRERKENRERRWKKWERKEWEMRKPLVNKKPFFILQYSYSALSKMRVHCSRIVNFIAFISFDGECFWGFSC